jgi:hypothetical protein
VGERANGSLPGNRLNPYVVACMSGLVVLVVLGTMTVARVVHGGTTSFYRADDSRFFREVARDPLGSGGRIVMPGRAGEASYRYGRILLPALAWLAAAGHPHAVTGTLIFWNVVAFGSIVLFAGLLLHERGGDARWSIAVLMVPGLFLLMFQVYAEPLMLACTLAGCWFAVRGRQRSAIACFAAAILARETAALVLLPFVWRAVRRRDVPDAVRWLRALLPVALWWSWVWLRVGQLPFLAATSARTDALSPPLVAIRDFARDPVQAARVKIVGALVLTVVACVVALRMRRWFPLTDLAMVNVALVLCMGPSTLHYSQDALRGMVAPQVFALLAIVGALTATAPWRAPARTGSGQLERT